MKAWLCDRFNAVPDFKTEDDLFRQVVTAAQEMGFDYCAYGIRIPVSVTRPKLLLFSNYPRLWREHYFAQRYHEADPNIKHCMTSSAPLLWSNQLTKKNSTFWDEARDHGLVDGWTHGSRDATGSVGGLALVRQGRPISASELSANQTKMTWLTQYVHAGMASLLAPKHIPELLVTLTAREKEVLLWTAEGKTAFEIGKILNLSQHTVNFHLNKIVAKLNTSNKIQAVVKASMLGLLS